MAANDSMVRSHTGYLEHELIEYTRKDDLPHTPHTFD